MLAQNFSLLDVTRDDDLAKTAMRHAMLCTIGVKQMSGARKEVLPQATFLVKLAGMDSLAIARRGVLTEPRFGFQDQDLAASCSQCPRHGETDNAAANNDTIRCLHQIPSFLTGRPK